MASAGCRDCAMCTGNAFTGMGRSMGRGLADFGTLGISHLARRKCKPCGHPMSEHLGKSAEMVVAADSDVRNEPEGPPKANRPNPARWVLQTDGRYRWWAGESWTNEFTMNPNSPNLSARPTFPEPQAMASETATDPLAQLRQLAELRDAGIVTEEEFAAKKAEILARM
jgi:hypothetical protein